MTRFTRAKPTHQRVEGASTSWDDLKKTPPKSETKKRRNDGGRNGNGNGDRGRPQKRQRLQEDRRNDNGESANFTPIGDPTKKNANVNVRGEGKTKSVKIFGNFWVGEDDARRLQGVAKKLKTEGMSRKDILKALENERRKAEKTRKRRRDKTCFNCRQFGHVLSDCPTANGGNRDGKEGEVVAERDGDICFKCGSTEHISRMCRRKSDKFSFAKCFVCKESGHIARQCPNNTNGIYPSGGSCDECGSIMHLKTDCPDIIGQEGGGSGDKDDSVPQLGRLSNPFLSTEYEEVPVETDGDDLSTLTAETQENITVKEADPVPVPAKNKNFKNQIKNKRMTNGHGKAAEANIFDNIPESSEMNATVPVSKPSLLKVHQGPKAKPKKRVVRF